LASSGRSVTTLRVLTYLSLLLLTAEFLLGMYVNLFIKIPEQHPGSNAASYFTGVVDVVQWAVLQAATLVSVHASLGLFLVVFALLVLLVALISRRGWAIVWAFLGFVGVLAGGFNGASFLIYREVLSSMLMAGGFALALVAYSSVLLVSRR